VCLLQCSVLSVGLKFRFFSLREVGLTLLLSRTIYFPLLGIWLCIQAKKEICLLKCPAVSSA
jgi:hypothetical protein